MNNSTSNATIKDYRIAYALYSETGRVVAYSFVYGLISVVALIGNLMVVMVVLFNKNMHTATNVLLVNLSMSDIVFVLFAVPGLLVPEIYNSRWVLGDVMARVQAIATTLCFASSVFTMMAIALERYFAVVHPFKTMARKKKWTVVLAITIIWTCAIAMSIPPGIYTLLVPRRIAVLENDVITARRETVYFLSTSMDKEAVKIQAMTFFVVLNVIPILVLSYFYARIAYRLWNPDKQLTQQQQSSRTTDRPSNFVARARRKTTIMLIVVLTIFFLLMFPYSLCNIVVVYVGVPPLDIETLTTALSVVKVFVVLNSATNPIIYNFLSEKFRKGFRGIFTCHLGQSARVASATTLDGETILA